MEDTQVTGNEAPVQDTATTQANEADVQVTNETPEATQTQEGTSEVKAEDTVENKLYAGKYKSVEEMEKAYQELNSKFTSTSQEKAELSRLLTEAFYASESEATTTAQQADDYADDYGATNNQADDSVHRDIAVMKFTMAHPDADGASMMEVLSKDPYVKNINGHEAKLEYAYLRSQSITQPKVVEEAKKQAAQAAQAKVVEKQTAQVETAQKAEQVDEKTELKNKATSGTYEERRAARQEYLRKYVV